MQQQPGKLIRALAWSRTVRVLGIDLTNVAKAMCDAHKLRGAAAHLASDALTATCLMSGQIKGEERLTLQMQFENLTGSFMGEIDASNHVRAMFRPARVRWQPGQHLHGAVLAIKHDADRELYRGVTLLEHDSIESALMDHLQTSNQLDVIVRMATTLNARGELEWVGGLVLERLPDGDEAEFRKQHERFRNADLETLIRSLEDGWLLDEEMDVLEIWKLRWKCRCSREKVRSTLVSLGPDTLRELLDDPGYAAVTCHFCNQTHQFEPVELKTLLEAYS